MMLSIKEKAGVETSPMENTIAEITQIAVQVDLVNIVDVPMPKGTAQCMEKNAKKLAKTFTLRLYTRVEPLINMTQAALDPKRQG